MQANQIVLVQNSWKKVLPIRAAAAEIFYSKLFELDPSLRSLFKGDMKEQGNKLMMMIGTAVGGLSHLSDLVPAVEALGVRHAGYGVKEPHYDTVGSALVFTLQKGLGADFTDDVKAAWIEVYGILAATMKKASFGLITQ